LAELQGNATEKTFAETMIKDHQKTSEDLKSMVSCGDVKNCRPRWIAPTEANSTN
jgi:putative membrane protein